MCTVQFVCFDFFPLSCETLQLFVAISVQALDDDSSICWHDKKLQSPAKCLRVVYYESNSSSVTDNMSVSKLSWP